MENIIGQKIIEIRAMTKTELDAEGWEVREWENVTVLVLENGVKLYASQDEEGNGPGNIFGTDGTKQFGLILVNKKQSKKGGN